jgi:hypothetical protein
MDRVVRIVDSAGSLNSRRQSFVSSLSAHSILQIEQAARSFGMMRKRRGFFGRAVRIFGDEAC